MDATGRVLEIREQAIQDHLQEIARLRGMYEASNSENNELRGDVYRLKEALTKLANEVSGWLGGYGDEMRAIAGNTNYAVLKQRCIEARAAVRLEQ